MDKLTKDLDEAFALLRVFVNDLNSLLKTMNRLRQLCDVLEKELKEDGDAPSKT